MTAKLRLSDDLSLPLEPFITSKTGILGKSGRGKSGAVKVVAEELLAVGVPTIILDPVGIHWGLRASYDGRKAAFKLLVVGGKRGDLRLDPAMGADVARGLVEANVTAVIDFSLCSMGEQRRFMGDFGETLLRVNDRPRHVIFEEAQLFAPERLITQDPGMARCKAAVEKLVGVGRNMGLGFTFAVSRPARISKEVLSQADTLICFGVIGPHDKKALKEWVDEKGDSQKFAEFIDGLARLKPREAWVWSPEKFGVFQQVRIRTFRTFHPDLEHLQKEGLLKVKPATPDLAGVKKRLGASLARLEVEKEEAKTATQWKAKVQGLEASLKVAEERARAVQQAPRATQTPPGPPRPPARLLKRWEREVAKAKTRLGALQARAQRALVGMEAAQDALTEAGKGVDKTRVRFSVAVEDFQRHLGKFVNLDLSQPASGNSLLKNAVANPHALHTDRLFREKPKDKPVLEAETGSKEPGALTPAKLRVLAAMLLLEGRGVTRPTRSQAAFWAEASPRSSSYGNNLSALHTAGLVDYPGRNMLSLTPEGREVAGTAPRSRTEEDFLSRATQVLSPAQMRIVKAVRMAHPQPLSRVRLAEMVGTTPTSSSYGNNLSALHTAGLIGYLPGSLVKASEVLLQ